MEDEDARAEVKLRTTLEELASGCLKYVAITKNSSTGLGSGKTKLDKERMKLCEREIVRRILASRRQQLVYSRLFFSIGGNRKHVKEFESPSNQKFNEGSIQNCSKLFTKT